jgi:DNA-binding CsgD family transcriptional regulator
MSGFPSPDGASAETLALLVDALVWPLMLLRPDGTLLHANSAALQALTLRRHLMLGPQQRLQTADVARAEELQATLAAAHAGQRRLMHWPGTEDCTATVMPLAAPARLPRTDDLEPVILVALGMASGHADVENKPSSTPGSPQASHADADTSAYAKANGLSRAEARVLQRLALGDSPARAAQALGVSVATVRSQAAAIRRKTGHSSTAALVSAAARSSPIWPDQAPQSSAQAASTQEPPAR